MSRIPYVDTTKKPRRSASRAFCRRLLGTVDRALRSSTPTATWREATPALAIAADKAHRELLVAEMHRHGRDPDDDWLDAHLADRAKAVAIAAATMSPATAVHILERTGVEINRAVKAVVAVGPAIADTIAWLSVVDLLVIDDADQRGAA